MALNQMLAPYHKKFIEGRYDHVLRPLPLLPAVPTLALFAVDLHRYERYSALHHAHHPPSLILDAIALAFVGLTILWALIGLTTGRYGQMRPWFFAFMDFLLSTAALGLADTTFSLRNSTNCFRPLGECTTSVRSIMQAAGALLIITSIPNHLLWTAACGRGIARRRQKKRDATSTDAAVADPEVISFSNEFLPKTSESETSMDVVAVVADPDAMSFSNEIK